MTSPGPWIWRSQPKSMGEAARQEHFADCGSGVRVEKGSASQGSIEMLTTYRPRKQHILSVHQTAATEPSPYPIFSARQPLKAILGSRGRRMYFYLVGCLRSLLIVKYGTEAIQLLPRSHCLHCKTVSIDPVLNTVPRWLSGCGPMTWVLPPQDSRVLPWWPRHHHCPAFILLRSVSSQRSSGYFGSNILHTCSCLASSVTSSCAT